MVIGFVSGCGFALWLDHIRDFRPRFNKNDCIRNYSEQFKKDPMYDLKILAVGHKIYNIKGRRFFVEIESIDKYYYRIDCKEAKIDYKYENWVKEKTAKVNDVVINTETEIPWKIVKTYGKELSENVLGCKIN